MGIITVIFALRKGNFIFVIISVFKGVVRFYISLVKFEEFAMLFGSG